MLAPFLIMLREGIEAALIVGIIASYLSQTGRSSWMPTIWVGVLLAVALSLFVGAGLQLVSAEFPQKTQELFESVIGFVAVVVLTSMVFWMRKAGRALGSDLRRTIDTALTGSGAAWALVGMAFFAVAREGLESVFFLLAIFQQSTEPTVPLSALAGVIVSVVFGIGIFYGGLRIKLGRFFRWTGAFILVVAAGILAGALRSLHEAGIWNALQGTVYDLSGALSQSSPVGTILSGLFGYMDAPRQGEVLVYLAFLTISFFFFLRPPQPARPALAGQNSSGA